VLSAAALTAVLATKTVTAAHAGLAAMTVESDDNFQSWDAQHIIPPPAAGP
jgi:hypothetical protein